MLREAKPEELNEILELYLYLHEDSIPEDRVEASGLDVMMMSSID